MRKYFRSTSWHVTIHQCKPLDFCRLNFIDKDMLAKFDIPYFTPKKHWNSGEAVFKIMVIEKYMTTFNITLRNILVSILFSLNQSGGFLTFQQVEEEGLMALWKGFTPYSYRLGRHTALTFMFLEQLNKRYVIYMFGEECPNSRDI